MARMIDADALIEKYIVVIRKDADEKLKTEIAVLLKDIEEQPTIDAEPVRHGKWMEVIEVNELGEPYQSGVCCSECGHTDTYEPNYCPNCGARMDAERKEE